MAKHKLIGGGHGGEHAEGDEGWLVSYADMVTLLFGFFVILYSLSQQDDKKMQAVGKEIAEQFKGSVDKTNADTGILMEARQIRALQMLVAMLNLGDNVEKAVENVEKIVAGSKDLETAKKILMKDMKGKDKVLEELKATVKDTEDSIEISLPDNALFLSGGADLVPGAKVGLKRVAGYLQRIRGLSAIEVVGHTDSLPPSRASKYPSNYALSAARAGAVTEELIKHGLDPKGIATRGMASLAPLFPERRSDRSLIAENLAKNRRVSILIKKKKANEPAQ